MTRIDIPKFEHERALADENAPRVRLRPKGAMNELMRDQKGKRDAQTEERQSRFFVKKEEPDTPDIAKARQEAEAARVAADEARRSLERRTS